MAVFDWSESGTPLMVYLTVTAPRVCGTWWFLHELVNMSGRQVLGTCIDTSVSAWLPLDWRASSRRATVLVALNQSRWVVLSLEFSSIWVVQRANTPIQCGFDCKWDKGIERERCTLGIRLNLMHIRKPWSIIVPTGVRMVQCSGLPEGSHVFFRIWYWGCSLLGHTACHGWQPTFYWLAMHL